MSAPAPSGHTYLDFNSPMSDDRASQLIATLGPLDGARVLDLGCGWAELLLRLLAGAPTARGLGIDEDGEAVERGATNAVARGLGDRADLVAGDLTAYAGEPVDVVLASGVSHAWGGAAAMLDAIGDRLKPGGRVLIGDGIWERPPTARALTLLEATEDDFPTLAGLVDLALERGYRLLSLAVANADEWDSFESRWCLGREQWLLDHPDAPQAAQARDVVDRHREAWLAYRGILGFAYLTLVKV